MSPLTGARLSTLFSVLAKVLALVASAAGYAILLGWRLNLPAFEALIPHGAVIPMPVGACLVLAGTAAWFLPSEDRSQQIRTLGSVLSGGSLALALLNVGHVYLSWHWDWLDQVYQFLAEDSDPAPRWMSLPTALALAGPSLALLILHTRRGAAWALWLVVPGLGIALGALLAFWIEGQTPLSRVLPWPTSSALLALNLSPIFAYRRKGLLGLLTSRSLGGMAMRRLLPVLVLVPALLDLLRRAGQKWGWFGPDLGGEALLIVVTALAMGLVCLVAMTLHRLDVKLASAQRAAAESRTRLHLALQAGGIGTWTWNTDTDVTSSDDHLPHLLNIPMDTLTGGVSVVIEAVHPEDREKVKAALVLCRDAGQPFQTEFRVPAHGGEARHISMRGQIQPDVLGKPVRMVLLCQDLTEQRAAEQALQGRISSLEQAWRGQQVRTSIKGFALKEPLRNFSAQLQTLLTQPVEDEATRKLMEDLAQISQQLHAPVEDFLTAAFAEPKLQDLPEINLEEVWEKTLMAAAPMIVETASHVTRDPLPRITADFSHMEILLGQLLDNALSYRGEALPNIHLGVQFRKTEWQFSLSDNGPGINPRDLGKLFEPFPHPAADPTQLKVGVGLALCRKIVEHHGGRIWLESELGRGSKFYFTLPQPRITSV